MTNRVATKLYRSLLRFNKQWQQNPLFCLRELTDAVEWGTHGFKSEPRLEEELAIIKTVLPSLAVSPVAPLDAANYKQLVSDNFRALTQQTPGQRLDDAFTALRFMSLQTYLAACSSTSTTEGVKVDATSWFSAVARHTNGYLAHVFTYRIRVTNLRQENIQVMGRGWNIKNDQGQVTTHVPLANNAVIGQKPIIPPGQSFQYHSGTELDTPAGLQDGKLKVYVLGKGRNNPHTLSITADIAPFPLMTPNALKP